MSYFDADKTFGELKIAGTSLHTFAWCMRDIRPLFYANAFRGKNVVIPGVDGTRAYPIRPDETTHDLPMFWTPACSTNGTNFASLAIGYQTNMAAFQTAFLTPPSSPTATLAATITSTPLGTTLSADVQVLGFDIGPTDEAIGSPYVWKARLTLRIPAGRFE